MILIMFNLFVTGNILLCDQRIHTKYITMQFVVHRKYFFIFSNFVSTSELLENSVEIFPRY